MMANTIWMMFIFLTCVVRFHNHSGPYHYIKCYVTIKNTKIARFLMSDWLDSSMHVKNMYPEYLNRISCFGLIEYILVGLGYLWVLWILLVEKNAAKAYDYGLRVGAVVLLFAVIKRENAAGSIDHYWKLVKEGKIDLLPEENKKI